MRSITAIVRLVLVVSFAAFDGALAHPGSGIVVDRDGQVYFSHTGVGLWRIDAKGRLVRHEGHGNHFLALDARGDFIEQRWPRYLEQMRPGVIRYGDAEIQPVGRSPTLLNATSFPIAVGPDGNLYYPEAGTDERVHVKRLAPGGQPTEVATLPLSIEISPDNTPWKALWIHGLAAASDGTLCYTEKEAVRRIDAGGTVSLIAGEIKVPGCVHGPDHRGGPILRGLDVTTDGTLYVAAMACQAVLRITQDGKIDVALRSEDSWTPTGIAVKDDDVYVLEFWHAEPGRPQSWIPRVRKLSADGSVTLLAMVGAAWRGLHERAVPLRALNLNETKATVAFFYHAPAGVKTPGALEGRVLEESKDIVTLGLTVWKQDVAFHAYDTKERTLEVYLLPEHLKDPDEVRIQIVPLTKFEAPADVRTVRVVYLP